MLYYIQHHVITTTAYIIYKTRKQVGSTYNKYIKENHFYKQL